MRREYLNLASKLHKVCQNMNSKQHGIYSPNITLSKKKSIEEITLDIDRMIMFLNNPQYSYMSKNKKS